MRRQYAMQMKSGQMPLIAHVLQRPPDSSLKHAAGLRQTKMT